MERAGGGNSGIAQKKSCEDAFSKLEVVTVAGVGDGDCVGSLLQIWKLRFGHKS